MSSLIAWNPFRKMDELLASYRSSGVARSAGAAEVADLAPTVDISETDKEYVVKADLSGLKKEKVNVDVANSVLTVSGERKFKQEEKDTRRACLRQLHAAGRRARRQDHSRLQGRRDQRPPAGDRRRGIHGHTYTLRLRLCAPLNLVMGWIVDFGDVKELFTPLFQRLDHHPLHEIDGIADADVGSLARYIRSETAALLPALNRVDLFSTAGCGAIFSWSAGGPAAANALDPGASA